MSYAVHKVHGSMWNFLKVFVALQKGEEKVKTTGLVHNFIILANCLNHDQRSMSNGSMSYAWCPQKSVSDAQTDGHTDGWYYQVPTSVHRGQKTLSYYEYNIDIN